MSDRTHKHVLIDRCHTRHWISAPVYFKLSCSSCHIVHTEASCCCMMSDTVRKRCWHRHQSTSLHLQSRPNSLEIRRSKPRRSIPTLLSRESRSLAARNSADGNVRETRSIAEVEQRVQETQWRFARREQSIVDESQDCDQSVKYTHM